MTRSGQMEPNPDPACPSSPALTTLTPPLQPVATGLRHQVPGKEDGCGAQDHRAQCLFNGSVCRGHMGRQWPPCPVCLPTQPEGSTQPSHQCGRSWRWQIPRFGQAGRSRSPHSLCQAPGHAATVTPAQGPGPAAVWPHLHRGHRGVRLWTLQSCLRCRDSLQPTPLTHH